MYFRLVDLLNNGHHYTDYSLSCSRRGRAQAYDHFGVMNAMALHGTTTSEGLRLRYT